VFPEGERSIDGTVKIFRKGPAILASELGAPVAPAGLSGTYESWPRGSRLKGLRPVTIAFGDAIPAQGRSAEAINEEMREAVIALTRAGSKRLEKVNA
jgi:1-acyl-sn-glycerol-3-phosphate acyltransferase